MLNIKAMAMTGGAAFFIGTFGGGWVVHKVWYGKAAAKQAKLDKANLKSATDALSDSALLAEKSQIRAAEEADARREAENRLSQAYSDNARLAKSRASIETRIIEQGERIGQELKGSFPCIYEPWPDKLRSHAFKLNSSNNGFAIDPDPVRGGYE